MLCAASGALQLDARIITRTTVRPGTATARLDAIDPGVSPLSDNRTSPSNNQAACPVALESVSSRVATIKCTTTVSEGSKSYRLAAEPARAALCQLRSSKAASLQVGDDGKTPLTRIGRQ